MNSLPESITEEDAFAIVGDIDSSYYHLHDEKLNPDFLDQLSEAANNKSTGNVK